MSLQPVEPDRRSEIEVRPLYRVARLPIHLPRDRARLVVLVLVAGDVLAVALHLAASLPELRALTAHGRLASLDLSVPANLPWTFNLLKLAAAAALAALMALSAPYDRRADRFWWLAAAVCGALALADSARLHGIWVATVAPALFGGPPDPRLELASHGGPLLLLYLAAAARVPAWSRAGAGAFAASALAFAVAWLGPPAALSGPWTAPLAPDALATAWHFGLIGLARTLLVGALALTIGDVQARSVRYVYRGDGAPAPPA